MSSPELALGSNELLAILTPFLSAVVTGYTGFGGGLFMVPILAILFDPLVAVAIVAATSTMALASLVPSSVKQAEWSECRPVAIGAVFATFAGIPFLFSFEPGTIRLGMGGFVLAVSVLLATGWEYQGKAIWARGVLTGVLSGGVTGTFGVSGTTINALYFMSAIEHPQLSEQTLSFP